MKFGENSWDFIGFLENSLDFIIFLAYSINIAHLVMSEWFSYRFKIVNSEWTLKWEFVRFGESPWDFVRFHDESLVITVFHWLWVCETYVVHHLNGTGLHCASPTCVVHHRPWLCIMVQRSSQCSSVLTHTLVVHNIALYWLGGA